MDIDELSTFLDQKLKLTYEIKKRKLINNVDELQLGHNKMDLLRQNLLKFDQLKVYPRSKDQIKLHHMISSAMAKLIYTPAVFNKNRKAIAEYNGFKRTENFCAISLPRREGKSILYFQKIAASLVSIPGLQILFLTNNMPNAKTTLALVGDALLNVYGLKQGKNLNITDKRITVTFPDGKTSYVTAMSALSHPNK